VILSGVGEDTLVINLVKTGPRVLDEIEIQSLIISRPIETFSIDLPCQFLLGEI
jgi:hypothetical protein